MRVDVQTEAETKCLITYTRSTAESASISCLASLFASIRALEEGSLRSERCPTISLIVRGPTVSSGEPKSQRPPTDDEKARMWLSTSLTYIPGLCHNRNCPHCSDNSFDYEEFHLGLQQARVADRKSRKCFCIVALKGSPAT